MGEIEFVSVHIDTRLPIQPEMWTCSCLQMGDRRWFEGHMDEHGAWPKGAFRQYPQDLSRSKPDGAVSQ